MEAGVSSVLNLFLPVDFVISLYSSSLLIIQGV
jgi:hypothetical protein